MEIIKNLLLFIGTSLICFIILETTLSIFVKLNHPYANEGTFELYKQIFKISDNPNASWENYPNIDLNFSSVKSHYYTMHVITNSQGFRESQEIPFEKETNLFRIIGLGDSITFGASVENNETFLKVIESKSTNDNIKIETINFGVASSNTMHEYYYLLHKNAFGYNPDLILLEFTLNDFNNRFRKFDPNIGNWYYADESKGASKSLSLKIKELLAKSKTIKLLYGAIKPLISKEYYYYLSQKEIQETEFWINKIRIYADENNIKFAIIIPPLKSQIIRGADDNRQKTIVDICDKLDVKCLNLFDVFNKAHDKYKIDINYLYWDEAHPYRLGHQIIGETTYAWLYKEGIIEHAR